MSNTTLFAKLDEIESRYEEMTRELSSPEVLADAARFQKFAKTHSELAEIVNKYREWKEIEKGIEDSKNLLAEAEDAEMKQLAHDELRSLESRREVVEREVKLLLVPKDPNDEKNVILEIRAGTGGDEASLFAAELFHCRLGFFLEAHFASVDVIETARNLAGELDMRHLVFADRHMSGAVDQDIRALQQRISEKTICTQIFLGKFLLLVFVGRHTLEPAQRRDHRQQQMQLGMFRHTRLNEQCGARRIDPGSQPVHHHVPHALFDDFRGVVMCGQRVPVGHKEQAFVFVLHLNPVFQHTVVMPKMQTSGGPHTR